MVDPIAGLIAFLNSRSSVMARVGGRVWGGEVPRAENELMPREAILVRPAGGGFLGTAWQDYGDRRVDVDCYGASQRQAHELYLIVRGELKHLSREVHAGVLLHWARVAGDGTTVQDPRTDWPVCMSSWQVLASELAVTA